MRKFLTVIILVGIMAMGVSYSYAGEIDLLLQKLVDKGVLTPGEAQQVSTETKEQIKQEIAAGKDSSLPQWIQNTKLKGDFRLRYEWTRDKNGSALSQDRSRARIRARLGVESKINDKLTLGVGIATGKASDPRSRNITLGNDPNDGSTSGVNNNPPGSAKSIVLDYAYAEYRPASWATLYGGKFQNPLWRPYDSMIWKGDITPEGVGYIFSRKFQPNLELFMNGMVFFLSNTDKAGSKWPTLSAFQPGLNYAYNEKINLKAAFTYYMFNRVKGTTEFKNSSLTNTVQSGINGSEYVFNYNSINPSAELGFKEPFGALPVLSNIPYFAFFGDFIYNVSPNVTTSHSGFDAGIKFGSEQVANWGQWQACIAYSRLGRDAWMDVFTDSDRFGGKTNTKGITAKLDYGLGKNTWLTLKYYDMEYLTKDYQGITGTATQIGGYAPEQLVQVDWNMKF